MRPSAAPAGIGSSPVDIPPLVRLRVPSTRGAFIAAAFPESDCDRPYFVGVLSSEYHQRCVYRISNICLDFSSVVYTRTKRFIKIHIESKDIGLELLSQQRQWLISCNG